MNLFKKKVDTLPSILSDLNETMTRLTSHEESKVNEIADIDSEMEELLRMKGEAEVEAARAKRIHTKLSELIR